MATSIPPRAWQDNIFSSFGDGWALLTATKPDGTFNTMTASWGTAGIFWNREVLTVGIRPERYTYEFAEADEKLSVCFFDGHREALRICGTKSGRDCDKVALAGLTPCFDHAGFVYFREAKTIALTRKLYVADLAREGFVDPSVPARFYDGDGLHRLYTCEILTLFQN